MMTWSGQRLASGNLAENEADPDRKQHGGHRVIANERLGLIMRLAHLIDFAEPPRRHRRRFPLVGHSYPHSPPAYRFS
jgi:hypothetical protein